MPCGVSVFAGYMKEKEKTITLGAKMNFPRLRNQVNIVLLT